MFLPMPFHNWYVCNSLKPKVPVLEKSYVRFETIELHLVGPKNSCLTFLRRLLPLKHLWNGQTFEITLEQKMDLDFFNKIFQIVVSPTSSPSEMVVDNQKTVKLRPPLPLYPALAACPNVSLSMVSLDPTEIVEYLHHNGGQRLYVHLDRCWSEDEANLLRYLTKQKFDAATSTHPSC
uniref:Uncharacterized protein n=1 Tax=Ditylenchus dipsaci TaxID=166011 RepID=A0A915DD54_9BILA